VARIRAAIQASEHLTVQLVNYRKDGSKFLNMLQLVPVKDAKGNISQYVGAQQVISEIPDSDAADATEPEGAAAASSEGGGDGEGGAGGGGAADSGDAADLDPMTSIASLLSCESEELVRFLQGFLPLQSAD